MVSSPWAASTSMSPKASGWRFSARTGPARPRCSTWSPAISGRRRAWSRSRASTARRCRRVAGRSLGVARTYQRTRLFAGLTVEDNLYLALDRQRKVATDRCGAPRVDEQSRDTGSRRGRNRVARRPRRVTRRRPLPRPTTPTRGGHGDGHRPRPDDARRAGFRFVPRRTRTLGRTARDHWRRT